MSNKKALLMGFNYQGTSGRLNGCENDILNIKDVLKTKFGFLEQNITFVKYSDLSLVKNLDYYFEEFLLKCSQNDIIYIHYSGHGSSTTDTNGDEIDRKDEALIGFRLMFLRDDYIYGFIKRLPLKTKVMFVIDACHSGTMGDLKFNYSPPSRFYYASKRVEDIVGKEVVLISGCKDAQVSEEVFLSNKVQGVLTYYLCNIFRNETITNWNFKELTIRLNYLVKQGNFVQVPELSSNLLNVFNSKIFIK